MTKYLSSKLTFLYTLLIIMVVYIHSYYLEAESYPTALFLQKFVGGGICRIANCMFFSISGYLFARNLRSIKDIGLKLKKRLRTLLVPYILWNVIFVLWYVVLALVPGLERFNNSSDLLHNYFGGSVLNSLYNLFVTPAAFQLWFLRDLLVMLALSPLMWWITRKSWIAAVAIISVSIIFYPIWLIYFWAGLVFAMKNINVEKYPRPVYAVAIGLVLYVGYALWLACGHDSVRVVDTLMNFIGLYLVWSIYDLAIRGGSPVDEKPWKWLCGYSFFIYCFHEPAFNIIKKLALVIFGTSEPVLIFFYLVNPWIMVTAAVAIAILLRRILPRTYGILTGGR